MSEKLTSSMPKEENEKLGKKKKLVIIDGKSVFYRGYYAMPNLSKSDGTPTSGIYGFATIAMEIVKKLTPTKVVVAWDKAKTSIKKRTAIYPDYKAGRIKPPEDFFAQFPLLKELIEALGWGFLEADEYEADDIIGTLAKQADEENDEDKECLWKTYIISSDLDMLQIVDENTKMYRLLKGFSKLEEIDVNAVEKKYGILKSQFLELKAIKGDNSDNIPGIVGIGEKGAVKLLNQYGTLEGIYQNLDKITGSIRDKLEVGRESAKMSYKLAKIMTDAPVSLSEIPDLVIDKKRILEKLKELEFFSLVRKYKEDLDVDESEKSQNVTKNEKMEREIILPKDTIIADDIKNKMHRDEETAKKILAGGKYFDLLQAEFLLDPLARKNEQQVSFNLIDEAERYRKIIEGFKKFPKLEKIYTEFDAPLIPILYKMEKRGILISKDFFRLIQKELEEKVAVIEQKIYQMAGRHFNINSPMQLSEILFLEMKLSSKGIKKTTRGFSTGIKELEKLRDEHEIIQKIIEHRELAKLLSTYVIPIPELADENGVIHTTFTQNITATGRLSSVNPNLQNIPVRSELGKKIREGFIARPGKVFVSADYAQFELRLAGILSGDKGLISSFNSGEDIHVKTASEIFSIPMEDVTETQRRAAKTINFGVMYGMSAKGLADATGMGFVEAKKFIEDYFNVRKAVREYLDKILVQARENGFVETFYGRRRPTPDIKSTNFLIRASAERAAQNMPIQGTEADLMKRAMIAIDDKLPSGAYLILQIHDSLVVETDEELADEVEGIMKNEMQRVAPELKIKLEVEVKRGKNLGEL